MDVLVVGGGPTGLATAGALAKLGIKVRIIEKARVRSDKSRAIGVHAGTLECLDHVFGPEISQKLISLGMPAKQANIHLDLREPIQVDFTVIKKPYNHILILEQDKTESVLEENLKTYGVRLEYDSEWMECADRGELVVSKVRKSDGSIEEITSKFVVGADGSHSVVRKHCEIPFVGGQYSGSFILGDVEINWPWSYQSLHIFANQRGVIASFPMTGNQKYRLIMLPKNDPGADAAEISFEDFKKVAAYLSFDRIQVLKSTWLTRFRTHHRIVDKMQKGRVFLAGDSAHIHSPAGGQGMNIGIQDGLNLAFKLKKVLQGEKPLEFLAQYHEERYPIARKVIQATDFFFRLGIMNENWMTAFARKALMPRLASFGWLQRRVVRGISEVDWARREINERLL